MDKDLKHEDPMDFETLKNDDQYLDDLHREFLEAERKESANRRAACIAGLITFLMTVALAVGGAITSKTTEPDQDTAQVMSELNAAEKGQVTGMADAVESEKTVFQTEISEEEWAELIAQGQESMKEQIFGKDDEESGISPYLSISGLTDKEKREAKFVESDFLRSAGLFLKDRGISTRRIIVENEIDCSVPHGMAFQGRLEKQDRMSFRFILFPSLPGKYIFMVEEEKQEVQPETLTTETSSAAEAQTVPVQTQALVQSETQAVQTRQEDEEDGYDATKLTISSVPSELLNYLDNCFVFQYSLYDYLFKHGKKDVKGAEVSDYSIDAGTRQATIQLKLSDGAEVTAVYSKSNGKYSFS